MKNFKPTSDQIAAAKALLMAMAYVQTVRSIVESYQNELLAFWKFKAQTEYTERGREEIILNHKHSYMMDEADSNIYLKELHKKHLENGFNVKFGDCPLLIAESLEREAKQLLVEVMEPVTKIKWEMFFNVISWQEKIKQYIDLTLSLLTPYCGDAKSILKTV